MSFENDEYTSLSKKTIPVIIGIFIGSLGTIMSLLPLDWIIKIIIIIFITFTYVYILVRYSRLIEYEKFRLNRKFYDNTNLLFYSKKLIKEILIHDVDGTATIKFKYDVKNISDKSFEYFSRQINFDGQIEDLRLIINCKEFSWEDIEVKDLIKKEGVENSYFLKFPIENNYFHKRDILNIELIYKVKKIYNKILNPDLEYTLFKFPYPVDKVKLIIKINPENLKDYVVINEGIEIKVDILQMEDLSELYRFNINSKKLLPKGNKTNKLIWNFDNPKVGNSYKLKFHIKKKD